MAKYRNVILKGQAYWTKIFSPDPGNPAFSIPPKYMVDLVLDLPSLKIAKDVGFDVKVATEGVPGDFVRVSSKFKPMIKDSQNNDISDGNEVKIGNGSDVVVRATVVPYKMGKNEGVAARLSAIQLVNVVEFAGSAGGFDKVDGGFVASVA